MTRLPRNQLLSEGSQAQPGLFRPRAKKAAHLNEEPVHAALAQGPGLREQQQAAADVGALGVQVGVHGVHPPPEVQGLREVDLGLIPQVPRRLDPERQVAGLRLQGFREPGRPRHLNGKKACLGGGPMLGTCLGGLYRRGAAESYLSLDQSGAIPALPVLHDAACFSWMFLMTQAMCVPPEAVCPARSDDGCE